MQYVDTKWTWSSNDEGGLVWYHRDCRGQRRDKAGAVALIALRFRKLYIVAMSYH